MAFKTTDSIMQDVSIILIPKSILIEDCTANSNIVPQPFLLNRTIISNSLYDEPFRTSIQHNCPSKPSPRVNSYPQYISSAYRSTDTLTGSSPQGPLRRVLSTGSSPQGQDASASSPLHNLMPITQRKSYLKYLTKVTFEYHYRLAVIEYLTGGVV